MADAYDPALDPGDRGRKVGDVRVHAETLRLRRLPVVNRTHLRLRPRCASCAATTTKPRTITGEEFLNASTARPTRSTPRSTTSRAAATDAFDAAFAEGHQLSLDETVAYIMRGRGPRTRPATGWEGLTPTERTSSTRYAAGSPTRRSPNSC